jgi:hypothetical protein
MSLTRRSSTLRAGVARTRSARSSSGGAGHCRAHPGAPSVATLRRCSRASRQRTGSRPTARVLVRVVEDHSDGTLTQLGGILVGPWHGSILFRNEVSENPAAAYTATSSFRTIEPSLSPRPTPAALTAGRSRTFVNDRFSIVQHHHLSWMPITCRRGHNVAYSQESRGRLGDSSKSSANRRTTVARS